MCFYFSGGRKSLMYGVVSEALASGNTSTTHSNRVVAGDLSTEERQAATAKTSRIP